MLKHLFGSGAVLVAIASCAGAIGEGQQQQPNESAPASRSSPAAALPGSQGPVAPVEPARCQKAADQAPAPLRRLTRREYENVIHDLLGDAVQVGVELAADETVGGFAANSAAPLTQFGVEQYGAAARRVAAQAMANLGALLGCDPARDGEDACARGFVTRFGRRVYRRPLSPEEVDGLQRLYAEKKARSDFKAGIAIVLEALLQSPSFLYRPEVAAAASEGLRRLSGYEIATRLAFLLWISTPDEELLAAAAAGRLGTREEIDRQARRMMADRRFARSLESFHLQWLGLELLAQAPKDTAAFPQFTPAVRAAAAAETARFAEAVVREGDGRLETLLSAPFSYISAALDLFYGIRGGGGPGLRRVDLPPAQRGGLLTQVSFLASQADEIQSSPVRRGAFVRERLLCQHLPDPPANVDVTPPAPRAGVTTRERFVQHRSDPACSSCHQLIDPIGLGFENYDAIGRYRASEEGKPIDARGELTGTSDADGAFDGAVALARRLATSADVRRCVARQWFRFALGRQETAGDRCALEVIDQNFAGGRLVDLVVAQTQADPFLFNPSP